jgi:hypothetical protein
VAEYQNFPDLMGYLMGPHPFIQNSYQRLFVITTLPRVRQPGCLNIVKVENPFHISTTHRCLNTKTLVR